MEDDLKRDCTAKSVLLVFIKKAAQVTQTVLDS